MREVPLSYEQDKKRFSKSFEMPDYSLDFLEFDRRGGLHIWEAKWIHDSDLIRGKVIGQLMLLGLTQLGDKNGYHCRFRASQSQTQNQNKKVVLGLPNAIHLGQVLQLRNS